MDDDVADLEGHFVRRELAIRAHNLGQELGRVGDLDRVGPERTQADRAELGVAQHDGVLGAPFQVGEAVGVDEVDLGLERRFEPVIPVLQRRHDRHIVGLEHVEAGGEDVCQLAFVDKDRRLAFAHRQLGAVFDLVPLAFEAPDHGVAGVVGPVDDVDELASEKIKNAHGGLPWLRGRYE